MSLRAQRSKLRDLSEATKEAKTRKIPGITVVFPWPSLQGAGNWVMAKRGFVYILTNAHHTVLYTGVTSNLLQRIYQHLHSVEGDKHFTARYNFVKLVYFAEYPMILQAISEEKRIKAGSRAAKVLLIESVNPGWDNLWEIVFRG
jgi:putative endonuclease